MCASSLFLLQKDSHLLPGLSSHNHYIPVAATSLLSLLVFATSSSDFWLKSLTTFSQFRSGLELCIIASTLPVWCVGGNVLWTNGKQISRNERLVVWLTPLSAMLLVVASSNPSRLLGLGTVMFGAYLMTYKLSLPRQQAS